MEAVVAFFAHHWQLSLIILGIVVLIGAIFNIQFIIERQGQPYRLSRFGFSDKIYRIILGIIGVIMILYGLIALFIE